ncbi:MAG: sortase [Chloroflexi bacterium]|nr:sortase [Chloroflexota bacterium]
MRERVLGALSWVLLAAGVVGLGGSVGVMALGAYQTATYRQPGVRAPWQPAAPPAARLREAPPAPPMADTAPPMADTAPPMADTAPPMADTAPPMADTASAAAAAAVPEPAVAPEPAPAPALPLGPPRRLRIPKIGVDAPAIELGIADTGEWELPNEEVGWYRHTALPGAPGNTVLVGHLNDPWGLPRVFARLKDVRAGDLIEVDAAVPGPDGTPVSHLTRYLVVETRVVPNTAVAIMAPTGDTRLTLFTCAGTWNFGTRDYSHRQVVVAHPVVEAASR